MAYGKYRINPAHFNQFRNMAYNDPMFALGELIGRGYMQNYEDRGVRKALEKVEAQYGDGSAPSANDMSQALDTVQQRYKQGARDTLGLGGLSPKMDHEKIQEKKASLGLQTPMGQAMFAASPLNDPNTFQGDSEFNKRMRAEAQRKQNEMEALKTIGAVPMTNYEIGNRILDQYAGKLQAVRDPQTGAITGLAKTPSAADIAEQAYNKRMADFSAKDEMSKILVQMEKDGRSPEQIARVTAIMEGKLQSMQDKAYEKRANDIMGSLANISYDDPRYQQAIAELAKYNPAAAKVYAGNVVTGRDKWNQEQQLAKEERTAQRNIDNYRTETGLMIERDNAVLENKVAQLVKLGYPEQTARRMLLVGNPTGGGGRRRSGGGSSGGSRSSSKTPKMESWQTSVENLIDQTRGLLSQGNTTQAEENIAALYSKWEDPDFREKLDSEDLNYLYQTIAALNYMNAVQGGYADNEEAQARLKEGRHILRAWGVI